jgi:Sushi repeat (SCR repeat)
MEHGKNRTEVQPVTALIQLLWLLISLEIFCPPLHPPENGSLSTDKVAYNTLVEVQCAEGYAFPDYNKTLYVRCVEDKPINNSSLPTKLVWNASFSDCQGMQVFSITRVT